MPGVLGAYMYSVQQLKEARLIIMGVALAGYAHACICTVICTFPILGQVQELQGKNSLMLESRVKLLIRFRERERIEIIDVRGSSTPD